MPKAALEATATTTHEVKIQTTVKRKLMTALKTYAELRAQEKALEQAKKKQAKIVEEIQLQIGETTLKLDGFTTTIVAPVRKVFNKGRYIAKGGDIELLESSYDDVLGTSYVKITPPGAKEEN